MELRELLKRMINSYFVIYGCSMMGTLLYSLIFMPDEVYNVEYFEWMLVFSLAGDLPALVFYSRKELTKRQWQGRLIIHFALLEAVLLVMAKYLKMYRTFLQGAVFAGIVLLVYILVRAVCFAGDFQTAKDINDKLRELRKTTQSK